MESFSLSDAASSDHRRAGAVRDVEDDTPIYIYSTINLYVTRKIWMILIEEYREEADGYGNSRRKFLQELTDQ